MAESEVNVGSKHDDDQKEIEPQIDFDGKIL
jgi:hypothetical protein